MKPLVIIGGGGHGRVVAEAAEAAGWNFAGFLDRGAVPGFAYAGNDSRLEDENFCQAHAFVVAIGAQDVRRRISTGLIAAGRCLANVLHPSCIVSPSAKLGRGIVMMAGVVVNAGAKIGDFCILNTGCTIDHDCVLDGGVQVCPGSHLAGGVVCAEDAFIGTGASLIPGVRIGARSVVGAGAVVIREVASGSIVGGIPATPLGKRGR